MNRINTANITGQTGQPFSRRSLDHLQQNNILLASAIATLGGAVVADKLLILTGAIGTGGGVNTYGVTAGIALLNGEVLEIPAHAITLPAGQSPGWQVVESAAPGDPVILTNGAAVSIHLRRQLKLADPTTTPPAQFIAISFYQRFLNEWPDGSFSMRPPEWLPLQPENGVNGVPSCLRQFDGTVRLMGVLNATVDGSLFTLPPGYRPSNYIVFGTQSLAGGRLTQVTVSPFGNVELLSAGEGERIAQLGSISFLAQS